MILHVFVDQYHQNKDDVIFTFDTHQNNYLETQEGKNLPIEHCIKNSDGWELYDEFSKKDDPRLECFRTLLDEGKEWKYGSSI